MWHIIVNGVEMPTIYWSLRDAINACHQEEKRGCAVITSVKMLR